MLDRENEEGITKIQIKDIYGVKRDKYFRTMKIQNQDLSMISNTPIELGNNDSTLNMTIKPSDIVKSPKTRQMANLG